MKVLSGTNVIGCFDSVSSHFSWIGIYLSSPQSYWLSATIQKRVSNLFKYIVTLNGFKQRFVFEALGWSGQSLNWFCQALFYIIYCWPYPRVIFDTCTKSQTVVWFITKFKSEVMVRFPTGPATITMYFNQRWYTIKFKLLEGCTKLALFTLASDS